MSARDRDERSAPDRRRKPRGGRRTTDAPGTTPLVLVLGGADPARHASEAVLAKLRFAVATSDKPDDVYQVIASLRPDVVVVPPEDVMAIRTVGPDNLRVVVMRDDPELLVEAIRRSLA